jgi:hypothetical protein
VERSAVPFQARNCNGYVFRLSPQKLASFFIAALFLKTAVTQLVRPYLAIAAPWIECAPVIWRLRKMEEQRASPKRLARGLGLSMAFFGVAEIGVASMLR